MGTRNLTMVRKEGKLVIAQYGQWDGNPNGQGKTVLDFILNNNLEEFSRKLNKTRFLEEKEIEKLNKQLENKEIKLPYSLDRDCGAEILQLIYDNPELHLQDKSDFLKDGLFCEYAYCIDLDKNVLEVYTSGNLYKTYKIEELKQDTMEKLEKEIYDDE